MSNLPFFFIFLISIVQSASVFIDNTIADESSSDGTSKLPFQSLSSAFLRNLNSSSIDFILSPSSFPYEFFNTTPTTQIVNITAIKPDQTLKFLKGNTLLTGPWQLTLQNVQFIFTLYGNESRIFNLQNFSMALIDCSFDISNNSIPYFVQMTNGSLFIRNLTFLPKYHLSFFQFMIISTTADVTLSDFELYGYWKTLFLIYSCNVSLFNCYFSSITNLVSTNAVIYLFSTKGNTFLEGKNLTFFNISTAKCPLFYSTGSNLTMNLNDFKIFNYTLQIDLFLIEKCYFCSFIFKNITVTSFIASIEGILKCFIYIINSSLMHSIFSGLTFLDGILNSILYLKKIDFYGGLYIQDYGIFMNLLTSQRNNLFGVINGNLKANYSNNTNYMMNFDAPLTIVNMCYEKLLYFFGNSCSNIKNCILLAFNQDINISNLHYLAIPYEIRAGFHIYWLTIDYPIDSCIAVLIAGNINVKVADSNTNYLHILSIEISHSCANASALVITGNLTFDRDENMEIANISSLGLLQITTLSIVVLGYGVELLDAVVVINGSVSISNLYSSMLLNIDKISFNTSGNVLVLRGNFQFINNTYLAFVFQMNKIEIAFASNYVETETLPSRTIVFDSSILQFINNTYLYRDTIGKITHCIFGINSLRPLPNMDILNFLIFKNSSIAFLNNVNSTLFYFSDWNFGESIFQVKYFADLQMDILIEGNQLGNQSIFWLENIMGGLIFNGSRFLIRNNQANYGFNIRTVKQSMYFSTLYIENNTFDSYVMEIWFASSITFKNLRFVNVTGSSAQIAIMKSYLSISNSSFLGTFSYEYFIQSMFSECDFSSNTIFNVTSKFIYGSSSSMMIANNVFYNSRNRGTITLSIIFLIGFNNFMICNNRFGDLQNILQGPVSFFLFICVYTILNKAIYLENIYFLEILSNFINITRNVIINNSFSNCTATNGVLYLKSVTNLLIENCSFLNNSATLGASIYIESQNNIDAFALSIKNNKFMNNSVMSSGASIYLTNLNSLTIVEIEGNIFQNNFLNSSSYKNDESDPGSVISLLSPSNILIRNNTFLENSGKLGACLYYFEKYFEEFTLLLENNLFSNNKALLGGGALYWANAYPQSAPNVKNTFIDNKASYADDYGTHAFIFNLTNFNSSDNQSTNEFSLYPGREISMQFQIYDYYNQKITQIAGLAYLYWNIDPISQSITTPNVSVEGKSLDFIDQGTFGFSIQAKGNLSTSFALSFSIDQISSIQDTRFYRNLSTNNQIINNTFYYFLNLKFHDECPNGLIFDSKTSTCLQCQTPLFKNGNDEYNCYNCPTGATCYDGILYNNDGYWRANNYSLTLYLCLPVIDNCVGLNSNPDDICKNDFMGPLCQTCSRGYAKYGADKCYPCYSEAANYLIIVILAFVLFIMLTFFVKTSYEAQTKLKKLEFAVEKNFNAAIMKILLNYTQSSTIMNSLRIDWGSLIGGVLQTSKTLSGNLHQVIALECFIKNLDEVFYYKMIILLAIPIAFIGILFIGFLAYNLKKKSSFTNLLQKTLVMFAITILFFHSNIVNTIANFFNCIDIEENSYIFAYLIESCDSENYTYWRDHAAIPGFIFYVLLFPAVIFIYMFKNRKSLLDEDVISKVGFMMNGYSPENFYWEFIFLFQKIFLIVVISYVNLGNETVVSINKGFICFILLSISFGAQLKLKPYLTEHLNDFNLVSSFLMLTTLFLGLFASLSQSIYVQVACFIVLLALTIYFYLLFIKNLLVIKISFLKKENKIVNKLKKNYMFISNFTIMEKSTKEVINNWERKKSMAQTKKLTQILSPTERGELLQKTDIKAELAKSKSELNENKNQLKQPNIIEDPKHLPVSEEFIDISERAIPLITKFEWNQQNENMLIKKLKKIKIILCMLPSEDKSSIVIKHVLENCSNENIQLNNLEIKDFESITKKIY